VVAAAAALLVAAVWGTSRSPAPAPEPARLRIARVDGHARVVGRESELAAGAQVELPATVSVDAASRLVAVNDRGDHIALSGRGHYRVDPGASFEVDVAAGEVQARVQPRRGAEAFLVRAGPWVVEVVGTRFSVRRLGAEHIRVQVDEGAVRVSRGDSTRRLDAGDAFDSRAVEATPPTAADPNVDSKVAEEASAPETKAPPATGTTRRRRRSREPPAPAPAKRPADSEPEEPAEEAAPKPTTRTRQLDLLEQARAARDADSALALLERAAALGPPLDEVASYRAASRARDAGRLAEALDRLATLIEAFPAGELTQTAHLDRVEIHLELDDPVAALRAFDDFASAYPATAARPEAQFLRAEAARAVEDWATAADGYAAAARDARFADPALFLEAVCSARLGTAAGAARARSLMAGYLERFPRGRYAERARAALSQRPQ
jgi:TolA-binding protein